ncbi:MAG: hypothetical protein ABI041_16300 [Bdellovibrionia bacterium]
MTIETPGVGEGEGEGVGLGVGVGVTDGSVISYGRIIRLFIVR